MSRTITVSTEAFAAIWADRQPGEESEDAILRRKFGCASPVESPEPAPATGLNGGVYDSRNNVSFPRGFTIFRTYKHRDYEAVAQDGAWVRRDTGERYPTLNRLNASITTGAENVWNGNWKYKTDDGMIRSIDHLRR